MPCRTYWAPQPDGSFEFLGAFREGHQVKDMKQPQGQGKIVDITDLDVLGLEAKLALDGRPNPPKLVGMPSAITKRFQAKMPLTAPWAQVEGYVR